MITSLNALIEALKEGQPVSRVWISQARKGAKIEQIKELCRQRRVVFQFVPAAAINRRAGGPHQGVCAEVSPVRLHALEDILRESRSGLLVVLDSIEDAGNLGAIIRTAAAVAADGVLVSLRRSAPLNETVWRTSAGALAKVKVAGSHNLAQDLEKLKEQGFWIVATSPRASLRYYEFDFKPPTALIFGSEARGVSPLLLKRADVLLTIPHSAAVESLNVAAAAAVLLLEAFRQKSAGS